MVNSQIFQRMNLRDLLYDGYKMNRELIEKVKDMAEDTNAMVTALDVAKFVHADNGKNLKIVK